MKKILYPTDFSAHSIDVLLYALELAKKFNAKLLVLHAYGRPEFGVDGTIQPGKHAEQMLETLTNFVNSRQPEKYRDIETEFIVEIGFPGDAVLEIVEDEGIDLVVMGMASKYDTAKKIFGSVAREVLKKVDCPILLIPTNFAYKKLEKIAYSTNYLFKDIQALNALKNWADVFESEINCLHVVEEAVELSDAIENMKILKDGFSEMPFSQFDVITGNLTDAVNQYVQEKNVDMVAMLSRKRTLFQRIIEGSAAQRLAKQIAVPLLVLKGQTFAPTKWETVVDKNPVPLWEKD